jgi:hypothetical protein
MYYFRIVVRGNICFVYSYLFFDLRNKPQAEACNYIFKCQYSLIALMIEWQVASRSFSGSHLPFFYFYTGISIM